MSKKKMLFSNSHGFLTNLVGYYPLNGNANDFSGKGHNGTYNSSFVSFTSAKVSLGAVFSKNIDSKITVTDNNDFSFTNGSNDLSFSLSLWVRLNSSGGNVALKNHFLIGKYLYIAPTSEWIFYIVNNKIRISLQDKSSGAYLLKETTNILNELQYYHLSCSYDGTGYSGIKIYINGVEASYDNLSLGTYTGMANGTLNLTIGNSSQISVINNVTSGIIDEVAIWKNRELTATEVLELYNKGNAGLPII